MGLLDELEQEAQRRRGDEERGDADRAARDEVWRGKLRPAMEALAEYLKKLTEQLAFLKRRARVSYALPSYGEIVAYVEPAFQLRNQPAKTEHEITLECIAQIASEECAVIDVEGYTRVRALVNIFQQHHLSGQQDPRKNANGDVTGAKFQARGRIPLKLTISADRESGLARMSFSNFEGLGQSSRSFAPDALNSDLFDALGRFIAREELIFAQESVRDDVRRQLQSKLQRDQLKREWEGRLATQAVADEATVRSYMGNAGTLLGRLGQGARKLFGR
jgi:hypothetical protein